MPVLPEIGAGLPRLTREADEPRIDGRDVNAVATQSNAAARELAVVRVLAHSKLRPPDLIACLGVQRDDCTTRGGQAQSAGGVDRCRFSNAGRLRPF